MLIKINNECNAIEGLDSLSFKDYLNLLNCTLDFEKDLLIGIFETNVKEALEPGQDKYILENMEFKSEDWIFPWEPFEDYTCTVWLKSNDITELEKLISVAGHCMFYAIVSKNTLLKDIYYIIYWSRIEYEEGYINRLYIIDKKENSFTNQVLPRIKMEFQNIQCIQDPSLKANE